MIVRENQSPSPRPGGDSDDKRTHMLVKVKEKKIED